MKCFAKFFVLNYILINLLIVFPLFSNAQKNLCSVQYSSNVNKELFFPDNKIFSLVDLINSDKDKIVNEMINLSKIIFNEDTDTILPIDIYEINDNADANKRTKFSKVYLNENDTVYGFLLAKYDQRIERVHISKLAISREGRRMKIGTALLYSLAKRSLELNKEWIDLNVLQNNKDAILFYKSLGFLDYSEIQPSSTKLKAKRLVIDAETLLIRTKYKLLGDL